MSAADPQDDEVDLALRVRRDDILAREVQRLRAENARLHSWAGLMSLLDEQWPADTFCADPMEDTAAPEPRIVALLRWVDRLHERAELAEAHPDARFASLLCEEYGIDRDYLLNVVEQDRSAAAVIDVLCDDRLADVRAGGIVLADAVRAVVRGGASPAGMAQLSDALPKYQWFVGEHARAEPPADEAR